MPERGFYFDFVRFQEQLDQRQTPTTPALSLMYALDAQLDDIALEGLENRYARHRAMAERCWSWVLDVGDRLGVPLSVLAAAPHRSPTVTCIRVPEGTDARSWVARMRDRGFTIGAGYGILKTTTLRIGHMGDHTLTELDALLEALEEVMEA